MILNGGSYWEIKPLSSTSIDFKDALRNHLNTLGGYLTLSLIKGRTSWVRRRCAIFRDFPTYKTMSLVLSGSLGQRRSTRKNRYTPDDAHLTGLWFEDEAEMLRNGFTVSVRKE